jgi:glutamate-1-semialdehyde 2,1-aminomutase
VHVVNFNDLESVRYVCRRYPVAALITEPVLQNIGVVRPQPGYLQGLRELADEFGFLLIFDEVKTGFRQAIGGYSAISGVNPDLVVYGKAIANGFPLALVGGKSRYMDFIAHDDLSKRPFVAGTYNGHPVAVAAAIRTVRYLIDNQAKIYPAVEAMGERIEKGILEIFAKRGIAACVSRQGSAFSYYLTAEVPRDFHDIISHHDFSRDLLLRRALVESGVFFVPIATKQCSISFAHTAADIDFTLERFERAVAGVWGRG